MAVVNIVPTKVLANDPGAAICCRYGHLRGKLVTLVSLAFADAHDVRFLQTVEIFAVRLLLSVKL